MGLKHESRAGSCSTSAENLSIGFLKFFAALLMYVSINDKESVSSVDIKVTNTF